MYYFYYLNNAIFDYSIKLKHSKMTKLNYGKRLETLTSKDLIQLTQVLTTTPKLQKYETIFINSYTIVKDPTSKMVTVRVQLQGYIGNNEDKLEYKNYRAVDFSCMNISVEHVFSSPRVKAVYEQVKGILDQEFKISNLGVFEQLKGFVVYLEAAIIHPRIKEALAETMAIYKRRTGVETTHHYQKIAAWIDQQPANY